MRRNRFALVSIALLCFFVQEIKAQSTNELINRLELEEDPNELEVMYITLMNRYLDNDLDSAYIFAQGFVEFADELRDTTLMVGAHYNMGRYYGYKGETVKAIDEFKIAQVLADATFGTSNSELTLQGRIVGMIGYVYYTNDQFDTALDYYKLARTYFEPLGAQRPLAITISTIGSIYYQKEDLESAKNYYKQSLKVKEELKDSLLMTSDIKNIAMIYQEWGQLDSARIFLERALEIDEKVGSRRKLIGTYRDLARMNIDLGIGDTALNYAKNAALLAEEYKSYRDLERAYEVLYEAHDFLGNKGEALASYIKFHDYRDSVINEESRATLIEVQEKYEAEKREKEIALLASKTELQRTRIILISLLLGGGLLFAILFALRAQHVRKKEVELKEKDRLLADSQKRLAEEELENEKLRFEQVQKELTDYALHIVEKNDFLEQLKEQIYGIRFGSDRDEMRRELTRMEMKILQNVSINEQRMELQSKVDQVCSGFFDNLKNQFPDLTEKDKRLAALIRLKLSAKEIAGILNIEPKSVEQSRYRLRKKLELDPKEDLLEVLLAL
ncbi:MAG: hypothetical protein ED557_07560 [Balneola sp.]|nr:MAG: hypothetical protein ED557_07560 [Balneola sp.]